MRSALQHLHFQFAECGLPKLIAENVLAVSYYLHLRHRYTIEVREYFTDFCLSSVDRYQLVEDLDTNKSRSHSNSSCKRTSLRTVGAFPCVHPHEGHIHALASEAFKQKEW